jgi:TonB family protein
MTLWEWQIFSSTFVTVAFGTVVRSFILALLCACAVWLLRSKTAELRWTLWRWTLMALIALPALTQLAPPIVNSSRAVSKFETAVIPNTAQTHSASVTLQPSALLNSPNHVSSWIILAPPVHLLVASLLALRLALSLLLLRRLANQSELIRDLPFMQLAQEIWLKSEASLRPRVAVSRHVTTPVTFNTETAWILLPPTWPEWSQAKLRVVLTHEMAHVCRDDSSHLQLASFVACLFWFHPLAWFLRRQLAALAEEACDETVVATEASPEQYANFLIEFARDVTRAHGRLAVEATAFVRGNSLKRRIQRIFVDPQRAQQGRRLFAAVAFLLFLPALYLTAAARFDETHQADIPIRFNFEKVMSMTSDDAAELETTLQTHPEDLSTRMQLLMYYAHSGDSLFSGHLLWFITHYPAARELPMVGSPFGRVAQKDPALAAQIQSAWQNALTQHPDSPVVIANAAYFIQQIDPEYALMLFRKAEALAAPKDQTNQSIAVLFAAAEMQPLSSDTVRINAIQMNPDAGARLRAELAQSNDPALLAATGQVLVQINNRNEKQTQRGFELIQRAIQLDPGNPKWPEVLESTKAEPQRQSNYTSMTRGVGPPPGVVRIGAKVAEASIITKIDPAYPPLALQARIQGSVEFTAIIGTDGKVQNLQLVRGHPLLVNAAKDAVLQWKYHPTTVDGTPIPFETEIIAPFSLSQ